MDVTNEFIKDHDRLWRIKGRTCTYCGKPATELHHIVPRHMGGDNRLSNIVPLCYECHHKAHSKRTHKRKAQLGRPQTQKPNNFDEVVNVYLECEISLAEALERTGLKRHVFYRFLEEYYHETSDTRRHRDKGIVRDGRRLK